MAWRIVEKAGLPGWAGLGAILLTLTGIGTIVPLILLWVFAFMRWPRDETAGAAPGASTPAGRPGIAWRPCRRHQAALADRRALRLSGLPAGAAPSALVDRRQPSRAYMLTGARRPPPDELSGARPAPRSAGRMRACSSAGRPARAGGSRHAQRHLHRRRPAAARARPARYQRGACHPSRQRSSLPYPEPRVIPGGWGIRLVIDIPCRVGSPAGDLPAVWDRRGDDGGRGQLVYDILGIYSGHHCQRHHELAGGDSASSTCATSSSAWSSTCSIASPSPPAADPPLIPNLGGIDISPVVALLLIIVIQRVIADYIGF